MSRTVCDYMKQCYVNGWISPRDGNISYKPPNVKYFYITPAGNRKHLLKPRDIVKMQMLLDGRVTPHPSCNKPSGELFLHKLFHQAAGVGKENVVVHCHPPHILAYIGMLSSDRELKTILDVFPEFIVNIANNVPHITSRTIELGQAVYDSLGNQGGIVALKQHGVVCTAETYQEAFEIIETVEYYCRIALLENV